MTDSAKISGMADPMFPVMPTAEPRESPAQAAVRELCTRLWAEPARLISVKSHAVSGWFEIKPHQHRQALQFDVIDGCRGHVWVDNHRHAVDGMVLMVAYPGRVHGYTLQEARPPSRVYHFKLHVTQQTPAVRWRIWPELIAQPMRRSWLLDAVRQLVDLGMFRPGSGVEQLAAFGQVLAGWPRVEQASGKGASTAAGAWWEDDEAVRRGIGLLHDRMDQPPSVERMAATAHLSVRQFARRFTRVMGVSPQQYIIARRLVRAGELLHNTRLSVAQVAEQLGFSSTATFSRWFTQKAGVTPTAFRADPKRM